MQKGGVHLDPWYRFFFIASPVKMGKDFFFSLFFFCNCLTISYASFGEKKIDTGRAIFTLITILRNVTKLVLADVFKQNKFFFKFYFKNMNVFTFFNFGKVVFKILVTWLFSRNKKISFLAAILKRNDFWSFFLLLYVCFGCIHVIHRTI